MTTIAAGQVVSGREAMASLRHEGDVVILDLVLPRGPQGEVGEIGPPGRDVKLRLGEVVSGSTANARLREDGPSSYVLDLCLPKGDRGDPGIGERGPQGLPGIGQVGPKGDGPTKEELSIPIRQVINENPEQFRGPMGYGRDGRDGVGIRGPQGKPGDISAAVAQAEAEARSVVQEALVEIQAQLERLERATK